MGIDARIYVKAKTPTLDLDWMLPAGYTIEPYIHSLDCGDDELTHEVLMDGDRFYEDTYERGPWPKICHALMSLLACREVVEVYYGSDCGSFPPPPITPEDVLEISRHWMRHGNRPYRERIANERP